MGGIGAILQGSCVVIAFSAAHMDDLGAAIMIVLIAIGVCLLVYGGMRYGFAKVSNYNRERADEQWERNNPQVGRICGIIMLAATALGLLLLFGGMALAGHAFTAAEVMLTYFWVAWPIGGITCGIAALAMRAGRWKEITPVTLNPHCNESSGLELLLLDELRPLYPDPLEQNGPVRR